MINFIYGSYGCGKTTEILNMIAEDTANGIHTFLLIPDQEALQFERLTLSSMPASSQLNLEILSFSRLYNRACREYGGLSYFYITKPMRSLFMWKSLRELSPLLRFYNNIPQNDLSTPDTLISTVNELKASGITAADLEIASKKIKDNDGLASRLSDLALIYACYDNFIAEKYSDSSDDITRLYELLLRHDFFGGCNVYLDSFSSYTGVQHKIIEQIFKTAENVTLTIPLPTPDFSDISTSGIESSHKKLKTSAEKHGGYTSHVLEENKRAKHSSLDYLSKNLWTLDACAGSAENDGAIICESCENKYAEAEAVAAHILELLRSGERCRDIVIVTRDVEKYRGIIDTALAKSDIPYFLAQNSDLCASPAVKFILSALRIKKYNWQRRDVIAHLKTGLCNIDRRDADLFEEYVSTWNINGARFSEERWSMNPDGFAPQMSERAADILRAANDVKDKLFRPLEKLFIMLDAATNLADMCRALYNYLTETELEDRLNELAHQYAAIGDTKTAREHMRIYGIVLSAIASVAEVFGEEETDTDEFLLILKNIFEKTEIGSIPTSVDEVTIGSAAMLRASNPKYAFIIGLCEGEFPLNVKDGGTFNSSDRDILSKMGLELSTNSDIQNSDELMYVKRAFSVPSERLYLFTHTSSIDSKSISPSLAFTRVQKLFPTLKVHEFIPNDLNYLVPSPKNAIGIYRTLSDGTEKEVLKAAIADHMPEFAAASDIYESITECRVSSDTVKEVMGDSIHFSATSFERYVSCPFGYFCSNVLKLREPVDDKFNNMNMGSFVHYILEVLIKDAIPKDDSSPVIDDKELEEKASKAVCEYIEHICPVTLMSSKRLQHLYNKLKRLALLLVRNTISEFSQSKFRPAFFELSANGRDGNPAPLVFTLSDGCEVTFGGIMDRVDVYKDTESGEVYVRIIDYKTGEKTFSLDDVARGINLQMLIYLFTLCRSNSVKFKLSAGIEQDKHALPAGVIYLSTAIPTVKASDYESSAEILRLAEEELTRSGLILNEENILRAASERLDSDFLLGVSEDKNGNLAGDALISADGFNALFNQISDTIIKIATALRKGNADAAPAEYGKDSPCTYCKARVICRRKV